MKRILIQIIIASVFAVSFSAAFAPVPQNNIKTITTTTLSAIRFEKETQTWFADDPVSYMAPFFL